MTLDLDPRHRRMTFDLDPNELRIVLAGLEQLPLGMAAPVYNKVQAQAAQQATQPKE